MGNPILLLRLEGPLQSWGTRSRWSKRETGPEPRKYAIIGLLGCAAGIYRPDFRSGERLDTTLEDWERALQFGVRVDRPGTIETDYHTVQGWHWRAADGSIKREHTEPTRRDYIHDGAFLVALAGEGTILEGLADSLTSPKWPPYLGRKCCVPSRDPFDKITQDHEDIESAFRVEHRSTRLAGSEATADNLVAWIEDSEGEYQRGDSLRLNQLRFYEFRTCRRIDDIRCLKLRAAP